MIENVSEKHKVFNPKNKNCPVCAMLNSIYTTDSFQKEMQMPEEMGKGYYRRIIVKPSMEIKISDITFYKGITMGERQGDPAYYLAFCLGEALQWRVEEDKKEYELKCGESYIFNGNQGNSICSYNPGQRFCGLGIQLEAEMITSLVHHMGKEHPEESYRNHSFYKRKFSPNIKLILNEMIHCPYRDQVKRIYLEGKILELIAVYMNESIFENGDLYPSPSLSSSDIKSLYQARRILDESITAPPTIGKLARLVYLNEYKLKTGFKELFGMPVHAYVIDKRLERARFLMENKKLSVTDTALSVGYSDASHFAEKFRKKYGMNPSQYSKSL
ncbi:helix-turn-helix transcriptional regulator [Clostridium formicaceticum]|uniref:AraC family transcriptional regulator n=1 Tax=Clostridium formicaceticum TaxID=1497 RepID=A0AAC9RPE3_9CLOT|nr:AraC family transcriptional regulator [Clostridium formicaceticum]AOY74502.1 AraC family transcriptional regulator [Clostridium formicaceticum]ARE88855.1 Regulatory protein PchR [Clostridium formicaceticum]